MSLFLLERKLPSLLWLKPFISSNHNQTNVGRPHSTIKGETKRTR